MCEKRFEFLCFQSLLGDIITDKYELKLSLDSHPCMPSPLSPCLLKSSIMTSCRSRRRFYSACSRHHERNMWVRRPVRRWGRAIYPRTSHLRAFIHNTLRTLKWRIPLKNRRGNAEAKTIFVKSRQRARSLMIPIIRLSHRARARIRMYVCVREYVERGKICTNFFIEPVGRRCLLLAWRRA